MQKRFVVLTLTVLALMAVVFPVFAQQSAPLTDTITVTGIGNAFGTPDIARFEIGVESRSADLTTAFTETNTKIENVIAALVSTGVAREDIRTVNLSMYQDLYGGPNPTYGEDGQPIPVYTANNNLIVTVRDINRVGELINVGIAAGATNFYNLNFSIADRSALESSARAAAITDARTRAAELAGLSEVQLGEIVAIEEIVDYFDPYNQPLAARGLGGGGGEAPIEQGELGLEISVRVTFRIQR